MRPEFFCLRELEGTETAKENQTEPGVLYASINEAVANYFTVRVGREYLPVDSIDGLASLLAQAENVSLRFRRSRLPSYDEARKKAFDAVAGEQKFTYSTSFYPLRVGPVRRFLGDVFGFHNAETRFRDHLGSKKLGKYAGPFSRLEWDGKQRVCAYEFCDAKDEFFFESDPSLSSLYGVPIKRIEMYQPFKNSGGQEDLRVLYSPYRESESMAEERTGLQLMVSKDNEGYTTTVVTAEALAGFDGGKTNDREVLFCAFTGRDGRTLVLNDLYPEFVWIEKNGGVPSVNGVDRPVLYLPKGWSASPENLQRLGEAFAYIDMTYEEYQKGTMDFKRWWDSQSVHARATTSDEGFWAFVTACSTGTLATIASEEEVTRHVFGGITLVCGTYLVVALRKYGDNYRNIVNERIARGNAFEQAVYKTLGRDDNNV